MRETPGEDALSKSRALPSAGAGTEPKAVVLYVDDDRANVLAFRLVAEPRYEVLTAKSAEEALKICQQRPDIAVLLSDQRMPGMSGIELCERTTATHPLTVRMLVTAYSDLNAAVLAINRGQISRYLTKPWNTDELFATLRDAVESYQLRQTVERLQVKIGQAERLYALGVLTASIGHELRTPLGVITSSVEYSRRAVEQWKARLLARKDGPGREDLACVDELHAALCDATDGGQRMLEVLDGIQLSVKGEPKDRSPVDVVHVVQSVLRLVRGEIAGRATLTVELLARPTVLGSATRLSQVLLNLILNALQALPPRRTDENRLHIRLTSDQQTLQLSVQDNGIGMSPAQRARIFEPFFTTKDQGTGLGLAICRQIVDELHGEIDLESTQGVGTSFVVRVPCLQTR
jgi:signal transduction histidine kinase